MSNLSLWRELDSFAGLGAWNPLVAAPARTKKSSFDYEETPDAFVLTFEIPGAERDKLSLEFHKNQLVVSGEQRKHGAFRHAVELPEGIQAQAIQAGYDDGILTVTVPKAPEAQPVKIAIGLTKSH